MTAVQALGNPPNPPFSKGEPQWESRIPPTWGLPNVNTGKLFATLRELD